MYGELPVPDPTPETSRVPSTFVPPPSVKKPFPIKKLLLGLIILVLLGGLSFVGFKMFGPKSTPKPVQSSQSETSTEPGSESIPAGFTDVPEVSELKDFKGNRPRVQLKHPTTWTVTETDDGGIRIESPQMTYQSVDLGSVIGNFRIYIRQGARTTDSKYIGRAVASQDSEKLTYSDPVAGQRPDTNLSFFGLDTTDHFAFFFIAGNYNLEKGDSLGPNFGKEAETYIITGGYSAKGLSEDMATNKVGLEFYRQTRAYKQAMDILKSLKLL
jgi:hypothetical protein